jgi:hypothetical protein
MDNTNPDLFQVYVREHRHGKDPPEVVEQLLDVCATYEEARRVRQKNLQPDRDCIIRYLGDTGGGD